MQGAKCTFAHVQDFAFLHIKNVQVPRPNVFIMPFMQDAKSKILHICVHARFCFLAQQKCASNKTFCFYHPTSNVQSARSCKLAHSQGFAFLHNKICKDQDLITSSPPCMQGAKCKILHNCTCASVKFL